MLVSVGSAVVLVEDDLTGGRAVSGFEVEEGAGGISDEMYGFDVEEEEGTGGSLDEIYGFNVDDEEEGRTVSGFEVEEGAGGSSVGT
jgi:hypothetical protein